MGDYSRSGSVCFYNNIHVCALGGKVKIYCPIKVKNLHRHFNGATGSDTTQSGRDIYPLKIFDLNVPLVKAAGSPKFCLK